MKRKTIVLLLGAVALAAVAGAAVGERGTLAVLAVLGMAIAVAAFIDLRITLLAALPAMVLLPELPLSLPIRTEDLLMVPLAAAWLGRLAMKRDRWPSTPLNTPLLVLVAVEALATLWGAYRGTAGSGAQLYSATFFLLKTVEVTLLYFVVIAAIRSEADARIFAYVLCGSAAALGIWGAIERRSAAAAEAIVGPAGHGGYSLLGLTFVVLLAVIFSLLLTHRSRQLRTLLIVAALPVAYSLIFTFSRQSYVGAVMAMGVLIWVRDRRLLIPAAALAVALPLLLPEVVQDRALSILGSSPDPLTGASPYATRLHALQRRLPEVVGRSPILGLGLAALPPGFLDNQYLLTLYYSGVVGLAVFLWLLWRAARTSHASYGTLSGDLKGLGLAWLAATVGLAVAGLAGNPFVAIRVRQIYWFLAGLTVAAVRAQEHAAPAQERAPTEEAR